MALQKQNQFAFQHVNQSDTPQPGTSSAAGWKTLLDSQSQELRVTLNNVIDGLANTTNGASNIGAPALKAGGSTNVMGQLQYLNNEIETLADVRGSIISVKEYGAVGNGATDDTFAIMAALEDVEEGGVLYFPAGTYLIAQSIQITRSAIVIRGDGYGSVIKQKNGANLAYMLGTASSATPVTIYNVLVTDLLLDGNKANNTGADTIGVHAFALHNSTLRNMKSINMGGSGYKFDGAPGIYEYGTSTCHIKDCWSYGHDGWAAEFTSYSADMHVFGGDFGYCQAGGMLFAGPSSSIRNAVVWGSMGHGIFLEGTGSQITGCNIEGHAKHGIVVDQFGSHAYITGNKIYDNANIPANYGAYHGIYANGISGTPVKDLTIVGNKIYSGLYVDTGYHGNAIFLDAYHEYCRIDSNEVRYLGNGVVDGSRFGIVGVNSTDILNSITRTTSTTRPINALPGELLFETNTGRMIYYDTVTANWQPLAFKSETDVNFVNIGIMANLITTDKNTLVGAINEVQNETNTNAVNVGIVANLITTDKANLVAAINEVQNETNNNFSNIGVMANLVTTDKNTLVGAVNEVQNETNTNATNVGIMANLTTADKATLVGAINEVQSETNANFFNIGILSGLITTDKTDLASAINEVQREVTQLSANVKAFGAVGNGTTDDTAAIQAAINSISAVGGTIFVPEGIYKVTAPILLYSNMKLALGPSAIILKGAAFNCMFRNYSAGSVGGWTATTNVQIVGGTIDANNSVYTDACTMVSFGHATDVTIENVVFRNLQDWHMIEFNAVKNGKVLNCTFKDYGTTTVGTEMVQLDFMLNSTNFPWFGPYDNTACEDITIQGCYFINGMTAIGSHSSDNAVKHKKINILNNHFESMRAEAVKLLNYEDVLISGNSFKTVFKGVYGSTSNTVNLNNIVIRDNRFTDFSGDVNARAIHIVGTSTGIYSFITVADNYISGGRHGIGLDYAKKSSITGNKVTGCLQAGIWAYGMQESVISNNVCTGNNTSTTASRYDLMIGYDGQFDKTKDLCVSLNVVSTMGLNDASGITAINNEILTGAGIQDVSNVMYITAYGNWLAASSAFDHRIPQVTAGIKFTPNGSSSVAVTIVGYTDTSYSPAVTPSWNTTYWITNVLSTGFTVNFGTAPGADSNLYWTVTR